MIKRTLAAVGLAAAGIAIAISWPDVTRYVKIRRMSAQRLHPEVVPAEGRAAYPQQPEAGTPDGTGDFDSARRGGPVLT